MHSKCCFKPNWWPWSLPVTWQKGCHTILTAIAESPMLYANFTALEPELLPIEVLHFENGEFHVFLRKIVEINRFSTLTTKLMQAMLKHIF